MAMRHNAEGEGEQVGGMEEMEGMEHGDGFRIPGVATYTKYSGWPELKEAFISGRLKAAYMLAPMAMDLAGSGIPTKIVALGHRSGAVIMVRKEDSARDLGDLRGQRVAIPSRFAVDHLFVRRMMEKHGLTDDDLVLIEMPPPDMPSALYANAVAAYATGEPFGAKAEMDGYARPLHMTRDEWPDYICCVLTVRQELIEEEPQLVQALVNHVVSAGEWLDAQPENRYRAAELAATSEYFGQDPKLLQYVMENPPDRVTYGDLRLVRAEFEELMQLSLEAGIIKEPIPYESYVDDRFLRNFTAVTIEVSDTSGGQVPAQR